MKWQNMLLDAIDRAILAQLQEDARITNAALAEAVGLSPSPCLRRVRQLEEAGVIRRYATLVDPVAVGMGVNVFVSIRLERQVEAALNAFEDAVADMAEVMECYLMTGDADYLLRIAVADLDHFRRVVLERLTKIPGVASIRSSITLKQVSYRTALPLGED